MKIEVEIPEGKYCSDCIFNGVDTHEGDCCYYLREELNFSLNKGDKKHPNCPSLKGVIDAQD